MKRWIAVVVMVVAVAPCAARADEASKQAKVKELFAAMHMNHVLDPMLKAIQQEMQGMVQQAAGTQQMTPQQKKLTQDYMNQSMTVVDQSLGWNALEPEYVKLYANTYTESEIDGILAFYKSPAGQAMLAKSPQLTQGAMQIVHGRMTAFQPKVQALAQQYIKQMKATMPATTAKPAGK
jgi:hypothetical protein